MKIKKDIDKRLLELELQPKTDEERRKLLRDLKEESEELNLHQLQDDMLLLRIIQAFFAKNVFLLLWIKI